MKILFILFVALILIIAVSGCTAPGGRITSSEQATETIHDVSEDIGQLEDTIAEIEQGLG